MALLERPIDHPPQRVLPDTIAAVALHVGGSETELTLRRTARPEAGADELLVRVEAAALSPLEWQLPSGRLHHDLRTSEISGIGADLAGTVEAAGRNASRFAAGDEVFGCVEVDRPGHAKLGSCSEFVCITEDRVARMPHDVSFRTAAATGTSALTALQGLRDQAHLQSGQRVLINGACGGVGTHAVQIAKALGAEVAAVCKAPNVELVRSLGADEVIDGDHDDFTVGGRRYDAVLDIVGDRSLADCRRIMAEDSVYVAAFRRPNLVPSGPPETRLEMYVVRPLVSLELVPWAAEPNTQDLGVLADLLETRQLKSVIERTYPLCDIALAMQHLESGLVRGKIVITL